MGTEGGTARSGLRAGAVPPLGRALLGLALIALAGCSDGSGSSDRSVPTSPPPSSIPVTVAQPHVRGPLPVRLQVGLAVLTPDRCRPEQHRVCSVDATRTWVPVESTRPATVAAVRTSLTARHTSWTTVVAFSTADAADLRRCSRRASALGGQVLVLGADRVVLAALPPSTIRGDRATLVDLEKQAAWDVVEGFSRDPGGY